MVQGPQLGVFRGPCEDICWGSNGPQSPHRGCEVLRGCLPEAVRHSDQNPITDNPARVLRWLAKSVISGGLVLASIAGANSPRVGAQPEGRHVAALNKIATMQRWPRPGYAPHLTCGREPRSTCAAMNEQAGGVGAESRVPRSSQQRRCLGQ